MRRRALGLVARRGLRSAAMRCDPLVALLVALVLETLGLVLVHVAPPHNSGARDVPIGLEARPPPEDRSGPRVPRIPLQQEDEADSEEDRATRAEQGPVRQPVHDVDRAADRLESERGQSTGGE